MKTFLPLMTSGDVAEAAKSRTIMILPIGTVDAQGPHMPLGYDYLVARELACRVCETANAIWMAPICYGASEALLSFPGTVSVPAAILSDLVEAVLLSVVSHGFDHILLLTNHNPNLPAVETACRRIRRSTGVIVPSIMPSTLAYHVAKERLNYEPTDSGHGADPHASIMLSLYPAEMRMDLAQRSAVKRIGPFEIASPFAVRFGGYNVSMFLDLEDLSETGSWGDPTKASKELGEGIVMAMVDYIVSFIAVFRTFNTRSQSRPKLP